MSISDYDLHDGDAQRPEYVIEGNAWDDAAPYLVLRALDADAREVGEDPFTVYSASQSGQPPRPAQAVATLADAFRGPEAHARVDAVRRALAAAVQQWWRSSALPSDALLRDGLLVLEAGSALDEAQRTLLARTALARGHGIFTALRHQTDPERVATLVHEAIMEGVLTPNGLRALLADEALGPQWVAALSVDLRADLASPATAMRAQAALNLIATAFWQNAPAPVEASLVVDEAPPGRAWVRFVVAVLLVASLALLWFWRMRAADYGDVIRVAAGSFLVSNAQGALAQITLPAFVIDRHEVTFAEYGKCVRSGACTWNAPAGEDPLTNPALAQYPVTGIDWDAAQRYCAHRAMRLPSAAEWEVAAGFAPATNRAWRFPWGEPWEPAFVIGGAENGFTATTAVGSRAPQGNSPLGAADMAGNAAEWTSTPPADALDEAIVKGGSFKETAADLQVTAFQLLPKTTTAPWLGFRCAANAE